VIISIIGNNCYAIVIAIVISAILGARGISNKFLRHIMSICISDDNQLIPLDGPTNLDW